MLLATVKKQVLNVYTTENNVIIVYSTQIIIVKKLLLLPLFLWMCLHKAVTFDRILREYHELMNKRITLILVTFL